MRVATICDIHGNLPALDAVLQDIRQAGVDQIVVAGDVLPGPMPRETLVRLLDLDPPAQFVYGNGELAVLAQMTATDPSAVTYWGTSSDAPLPEPFRQVLRWTGQQLHPEDEQVLASWPLTLRLPIDRLGDVLFCHATPRNETEIFTRLTRAELLIPIFEGLHVSMVVCGHTHMQFDRAVGRIRVVNAGSVGMPFGEPGADWLLLGPDVQLRRTPYDLAYAAARIRATAYPQAEDFAAKHVLQPPSETTMLAVFADSELQP